jgi:hypothetical protein
LLQISTAADRFDRLDAARQQRLRRLILRHRSLAMDNTGYATHIAD